MQPKKIDKYIYKLSRVQLSVNPWTAAHRTPLFMESLQATVLEWVALPFSRGSSRPRDQTCVSRVSFIAGDFFTC